MFYKIIVIFLFVVSSYSQAESFKTYGANRLPTSGKDWVDPGNFSFGQCGGIPQQFVPERLNKKYYHNEYKKEKFTCLKVYDRNQLCNGGKQQIQIYLQNKGVFAQCKTWLNHQTQECHKFIQTISRPACEGLNNTKNKGFSANKPFSATQRKHTYQQAQRNNEEQEYQRMLSQVGGDLSEMGVDTGALGEKTTSPANSSYAKNNSESICEGMLKAYRQQADSYRQGAYVSDLIDCSIAELNRMVQTNVCASNNEKEIISELLKRCR